MKASPWEIEDALHEGIPIVDNHNAAGIRDPRRQADRHEFDQVA
jgi:hypothetical protein